MKGPNNNKSLPWWVEFLFVQVGLPDNWLRSFLKKRKRLKNLISENHKAIGLIGLTSFFIIYYNPIRKEAVLHNKCIISYTDIISKNSNLSKEVLKSYAISFCNGGQEYNN